MIVVDRVPTWSRSTENALRLQCVPRRSKERRRRGRPSPSSTPIIAARAPAFEHVLERRRDPGREHEQHVPTASFADAQQFDDDGREKERNGELRHALGDDELVQEQSLQAQGTTETIRKRTFSRLPPVAMPPYAKLNTSDTTIDQNITFSICSTRSGFTGWQPTRK